MGTVLLAVTDVAGWCIARFPPVIAQISSRMLAFSLERIGPGRNAFRSSLAACFPDRDLDWQTRIHRAHLQRRLWGIFELIESLWAGPARVTARVHIIGWPQLVALQRQGVPVILLAGHFIGLPLAVRALAERVPLRVVARMFRHRLFEKVFARLGQRTGGGLIDGADGRAICRSLMQGETILILADYGIAGASHSAASHAVSRLAHRSGAVVLPLHYHRHGKAHQLYLGTPLPLAGLTAEALQSLYTAWIQESPAEYLWPRRP